MRVSAVSLDLGPKGDHLTWGALEHFCSPLKTEVAVIKITLVDINKDIHKDIRKDISIILRRNNYI